MSVMSDKKVVFIQRKRSVVGAFNTVMYIHVHQHNCKISPFGQYTDNKIVPILVLFFFSLIFITSENVLLIENCLLVFSYPKVSY